MDYTATYPNDYIRFHASDMILMLDTDATYLFTTKAWIRIERYYYLGNKPNSKPHPELKGAINIGCKKINHVLHPLLKQRQVFFHNLPNGHSNFDYNWSNESSSTSHSH